MNIDHTEIAELCVRSYEEHTISRRGVEVLVKDMGDYQAVIIRGTEPASLWDMLRNLWISPTTKLEGKFHRGYNKGWLAVMDEVMLLAHDESKPIVMAGHSAGGAMALIGAHWMISLGCSVKAVVTFGAPRAVDGFAWYGGDVAELSTQYRHARDPVPSWLGFTGYRHFNEVMLGAKTSSFWTSKRSRFHSMNRYLLELQRLEEN